MRKIFLAGAAMLATTGLAMSADNESFSITAPVLPSCSVTDPTDIAFNDNSPVGASQTRNFSFTCNFAGNNTSGIGGPLSVAFRTTTNGLVNANDSSGAKAYTLTYGTEAPIPSSALNTPTGAVFPETSAGPATANNRTFAVTLDEALTVAGTYSQTVNVTISP